MPLFTDVSSGKLKSTITRLSILSFLGTKFMGETAIGSLKGLDLKGQTMA
jgi:hypothetical protein